MRKNKERASKIVLFCSEIGLIQKSFEKILGYFFKLVYRTVFEISSKDIFQNMVAAAEAVFNRVVLSVGWFALGGTAAFLSGGFVVLCSGGVGWFALVGRGGNLPLWLKHWLTLALIGVPVMGGIGTAIVQTFAAACYSFVGAAVFGIMYAFVVHRKSD